MTHIRKITIATALMTIMSACTSTSKSGSHSTSSNRTDQDFLEKLMRENGMGSLLDSAAQYKLQVIYTQIDRDKHNKPSFTSYSYRIGAEYFYPASTVKLPAAVLALEYINGLKSKGLTKETIMLTDPVRAGEQGVDADPTAANGKPSVAHYIKKILLVSDNDAYNRLYELIGQEAFNNRLHELGFADAQIIHRLEISLNEAENRQTNPIRFVDGSGKLLYEQPAKTSKLVYAQRADFLGKGYMKSGKLVPQPMEFSQKNRWSLQDIHTLVQWIMFPESQPAGRKLNLTQDDYAFLRRYMSMQPQESDYPKYKADEYWPTYVKFLLYGSEKNATILPNIRIFNKVGDAYGFLLDGAYVVDFETGTEFLLSAEIYCNADGILNDNRYDYDSIGFPFMKQLGEAVYKYESGRKRSHMPDLSPFKFSY